MKKLLILLGVLLVGAAAVMPYFTGKMAETVSKDMVASLNENSLENGVTTFEEYERSYFNSKYTVSWAPPAIGGQKHDALVQFECDGDHGITSYKYDCKISKSGDYLKFVEEELNGKDPISVTGGVSLFGRVDQKITLQAFELTDEDNQKFSIQPGELEIVTDKDMKNIVMKGEFEGAQVTEKDNDLAINIKGMSIDGDFFIDENMISFGDFEFDFDGVFVASDNKEGDFTLSKMKLITSSKDKGENMAIVYKTTIDEVSGTPAGNPSKPYNLSDMTFEFEVDNLNKSAVAEAMEKYRNILKQAQNSKNEEQFTNEAMASGLEMMPLVEKILAKDFSISTKFNGKISNNPVDANLNIKLMDKVGMGDFVLLSVQPDAFLKKLNAEIGMAVPQKLVDMDPSFSAMVNSGPWYQKSGDKFESNLKIKDGTLSLNGKTYTVEQFQALLMQSAMQ